MDVRSPLFRNIALILAGVMFLDPVVAAAAQVQGAAQLSQAGNGVALVNIATPSDGGLSHNRFNTYNVGPQGLILNNATASQKPSTELAGSIAGNPNLTGSSAQVILNEVTGSQRSLLQGYTEVAGQAARVIVANPHGITCDGCGFLNTPHATLSSGAPLIDSGRLKGFEVKGGDIAIQGAGLDARSVDRFDLITRSARINAELHAGQQLNLITGVGQVDADDLRISAKTPAGSKPDLSIDSSALGGMYAGAIRLRANEAGVGVRLAGDMAASARDIRLDASGKLTLSGTLQAQQDLHVQGAGDIQAGATLVARRDIQLQTPKALDSRNARVLAGRDLKLDSERLDNSQGTLYADGRVTIGTGQALNDAGQIVAHKGLELKAGSLEQTRGTLLSQGALDLDLQGGRLGNDQGVISAKGPLSVKAVAEASNVKGEISSQGDARLTAKRLDNRDGKLLAQGALSLSSRQLENRGQIRSGKGTLEIVAGRLDNHGSLSSGENVHLYQKRFINRGSLYSQGDTVIKAEADKRTNAKRVQNHGEIHSGGNLIVHAEQIDNHGKASIGKVLNLFQDRLNNHGVLHSQDYIVISADFDKARAQSLTNRGRIHGGGNLAVHADHTDNHGTLSSGKDLLLFQQHLDNRGSLHSQGNTVIKAEADKRTNAKRVQNHGEIHSGGNLIVHAEQIDNHGQASIGKVLNLFQDRLNNHGVLQSQGDIVISADFDKARAQSLTNRGRIQSVSSHLSAHAERIDNHRSIGALGKLWLHADTLHNHPAADAGQAAAQIHGGALLEIEGRHIGNQGHLLSQGELRLKAPTLNNRQGRIGGQQIRITQGTGSASLDNHKGLIESHGDLSITGHDLSNAHGQLRALGSKGETLLSLSGTLNNRAGRLDASTPSLNLKAGGLDNADGQVRHSGSGAFSLGVPLISVKGGSLGTAGSLSLKAERWHNDSQIQAGQLTLDIGSFSQDRAGSLVARSKLSGQGGSWRNDGLIGSDGALSLTLSGGYRGAGQLSSLGALSLDAQSLELQAAGLLLGSDTARITLRDQLSNRGRLSSSKALTLTASRVDNHGTLASSQGAILTGARLDNHGLLLSGGNLALNLDRLDNHADLYSQGFIDLNGQGKSGTRSQQVNNHGSLEAQGKLWLNTERLLNQLTASSTRQHPDPQIRAGDTLSLRGKRLDNHGLFSSSGSLELEGEQLDNHGTLASRQHARLSAGQLNNHGLLGTGGDLNLQVDGIDNPGDIFSLGHLTLKGDGKARAQQLDNRSGTLEATGDLKLAVEALRNVRSTLEHQGGPYAARISRGACRGGDCKGSGQNAWFDITQRDRHAVSQASPMAQLLAGGNLTLQGNSLDNHSSLISAGGHLKADLVRLDNQGIETGDSETQQSVMLKHMNQKYIVRHEQKAHQITRDYWSPDAVKPTNQVSRPPKERTRQPHKHRWIDPASVAPNTTTYSPERAAAITAALNGFIHNGESLGVQPAYTRHTRLTQGDQHYAGIIQAAGELSVRARDSIGNGVQRPGQSHLPAPAKHDPQRRAVDPLALPGVSLPEGQHGLFRPSLVASSPYLIETHPQLSELSPALGAEYLLDTLGKPPGTPDKRLGDGLYEQKLLRDALVSRTGQRFIPGHASDASHYRLLMDNARASHQSLKLTPGKALTPAQIAALPHDIVWLERQQHRGQQVLAPVFYLGQTQSANGALIQGNDLDLYTGGTLKNEGTLRAHGSLDLQARKLNNAGPLEARRLHLKALEHIHLLQGSSLSGQQIDLKAGQDLLSVGSRLHSQGDLSLSAGRNLLLTTAAPQPGGPAQVSDLKAGHSLRLDAGQDLTLNASRLRADHDLALYAGNDLYSGVISEESHRQHGGRKSSSQHTVQSLGSQLSAGHALTLDAGNHLTLSAAHLDSGRHSSLKAGGQLALLAAENLERIRHERRRKGSFGGSSRKTSETTRITHIGTSIQAGGNLNLESAGSQLYQRAHLHSGADLSLASGGSIAFEGVKDLEQHSKSHNKSSALWQSNKARGGSDETLQQSRLTAQGELSIKAVEGLSIDFKQVDGKTVSQAIDAMVKADPELAWLKAMQQRGDVDWRKVKETHDSFKHKHSGLSGAAAIVIAIVVTYFTAGAASGVAGSVGSSAAGAASSAGATATTSAAVGAAAKAATTAVITSAASNAAISAINNQGDLGAVARDVTSSDAIKGYATSAITAALTSGILDNAFGVEGDNVNKVTKGFDLSQASEVAKFGSYLGLQGGMHAMTRAALEGGSLEDHLRSALTGQVEHLLQAVGFNLAGDVADGKWLESIHWAEGSPQKIVLHAAVGGLLSKATGGDFRTGALAAGANELLIERLSGVIGEDKELELTVSQLIGAATSMATKGNAAKAAELTKNATAYNRQLHSDEAKLLKELAQLDPARAREWDAAACALVACSESVPPSDPRHASLVALQAEGAKYPDLRASLAESGLFKYAGGERLLDAITRRGEALHYAGAAGSIIGGAVGAVASGVAGASTCAVSVGLGCALGAAGVAGSVAQYSDGLERLNTGFVSTEGQHVLDSFRPGTHPGDVSLGSRIGGYVVSSAAELVLERVGGKAIGAAVHAVDGKRGGGRVGSDGAKGTATAEVPATSAIARDGLRNDLAAQAGIPRSLDKVWGASVDDLAQAYKMDGATLVPKPALSGTSGKAQAFTVEGHPTIKEVQVHPGGGTHGAPYYKFTYKDGVEVRVIDSASGFKPGTITSAQQYFDTTGNRLRYEAGQWKSWE